MRMRLRKDEPPDPLYVAANATLKELRRVADEIRVTNQALTARVESLRGFANERRRSSL